MPILCPNNNCNQKLTILNLQKDRSKNKDNYSISDYVCTNPVCSVNLVIVERTTGKADHKYRSAIEKKAGMYNPTKK